MCIQTIPEKKKNYFIYLEELPFNMHVHHVEYMENGYDRLIGSLYMTTFRLVFAPDRENEDNHVVCYI